MKAIITVKGIGSMTAELYPEKAPETVKNFVALAKDGFYEGLIFHRVISGFMIQGGGFDESFSQKRAKAIKGEFRSNGFTGNDIRHTRGVLSMARTSDPDSASSQFFIMHADAPHLDGAYAAFGRVTEGLEVIDAVASVKVGNYGYFSDVPVDPVVIKSVKITD